MSTDDLACFSARVLDLAAAHEPAGYYDLPMCVIDAVFSVGMTYSATRNAVVSFVSWAQAQGAPVADEGFRADDRAEYSVSDAIGHLGERSDEDLTSEVFSNSNRTSSTSGILKARASVDALNVLRDHDIDYRHQLLAAARNRDLKDAWRDVHGQSSGISWRYLLMNAGHEGVKPDRMIVRFVAAAVERDVSANEAGDLMVSAHMRLQQDHPQLTLRAFDHAAWQHARQELS